MKKKSVKYRKALEELHYWQERVRMDISSLKGTRWKVKQVAAQLREIQNPLNPEKLHDPQGDGY